MRRSPFLRRAAAAAVLPLALTALSACGDDPGDDAPGSSVAADPGTNAGEEMPVEEFLEILAASAEGRTTVHQRVQVEGDTVSYESEGDVDFSTDPPSSRATTRFDAEDDSMDQTLESIQIGSMSYTKGSTDDTWIEMDMSGMPEALGGGGPGALDPGSMIEKLGDVLDSVVYAGKEEVDGEELARYTVVVGYEDLIDEVLGESGLPAPDGPAEATFDIWFDDAGLQRRLESDLGEALGEMTMTFSDWGKDVSIEKPPADQVQESASTVASPSAKG